ncbi:hypothetical protein BDFB_013675 [Asbolus verrucosus]|uniref:Uncharacterized protein n=1 Tax=Asbolus verrucosus TaxID=1661398 RepID=A0A482VY85_ASBVE|nr:hypothetical protein BDFB_013675 [Asbolus verrucosus]
MRFNKQELITLATQPSSRFEKEGILYIRERQDGFFRKSESKYYTFQYLSIIILIGINRYYRSKFAWILISCNNL